MYENRTLVRGDNLEEMRRFPDECIDLIATDPPFQLQAQLFRPLPRPTRTRTRHPHKSVHRYLDLGRSRRRCIPALTRRGRRADRRYHSRTASVPKRNADDGIPRHDGSQNRRNAPDPQTHRESIPPL